MSLLFFGAGASKPFDIPTMQEMVKEFEDKISFNANMHGVYLNIKSILERPGDLVDIEAMLSVIEGIADNRNPTRTSHYLSYYMYRNKITRPFSTDEINNAAKLREKIIDYISITCSSNLSVQKKMEIYQKSYVPLFEYIEGNSKIDFNNIKLKNDWKAYTTNYDNLFEYFWNSVMLLKDHFEQQKESTTYIFKPKDLANNHTFSKLHGSLDWKENLQTGDIIKKSFDNVDQHPTRGPKMLFPVQQKDLYLDPWFTLFDDLKKGLRSKNTWYVIGYAFNDEFIRNTFQEALTSRENVKLVLIDPDAKNIKKKFHHSTEQIDSLPVKFGDEYFPHIFRDYATRRKTIHVVFSPPFFSSATKKIQIEIRSNLPISGKQIGEDHSMTNNRTADDIWISYKFDGITRPPIETDLVIAHDHGEKIELEVTSNSDKLSFVGAYAGNQIIDSSRLQPTQLEHEIQYSINLDTQDMFVVLK